MNKILSFGFIKSYLALAIVAAAFFTPVFDLIPQLPIAPKSAFAVVIDEFKSFRPAYDIITGPDGNIWFTDDAGRIEKMTPAGVATNDFGGLAKGITVGPDGNIWYTPIYTTENWVRRMNTSGTLLNEYRVPTSDSNPYGITAGPDGNIWFVERYGKKVAKVTPDGVFTEYPIPSGGTPFAITSGPDGNLWFSEVGGGFGIGKITTSGVFTEYRVGATMGSMDSIIAGPDGNLWYTSTNNGFDNYIGRITTNGENTLFPVGAYPWGITKGPDGNLWFTEYYGNKIGRITSSGNVTEFPIPTSGVRPLGITVGPDGNIWFTESTPTLNTGVGRVNLAEVPAPTPTPTPSPTSSPTPAPPARQIVFVHGIKTSFVDVEKKTGGFESLLTALEAKNYPVKIFHYYQDLGYQQSGGCSQQPAPDTNIGPLFGSGGISPTICDSESAVAYNATGLDNFIATLNPPVTVIGYSMGAATIRGWLTLAQSRPGDQTLSIVDSVITIQGAQQGSYIPLGGVPLIKALGWSNPLWTAVINGAELKTGWNIDRPAVKDLTPVSSWYQSVNSKPVPPAIRYFNFYSDIQVSASPQLFFKTLPKFTPISFGDTVILPGDPNPSALPTLGGARFLPGGGREFPITSNYDVFLGNEVLKPLLPNPFSSSGASSNVLNDDISHVNLDKHLTDQNHKIDSCLTSVGKTTIQDEILRILLNPAQACN